MVVRISNKTPDDYFWVAEMTYGGTAVYAVSPRRVGTRILEASSDIHDALRFETKEACEKWIADYPGSQYVPREHAIMGGQPDLPRETKAKP